ncbi:hypothetical protein ACQ4LE_005246 [Meloidogyne hapla]
MRRFLALGCQEPSLLCCPAEAASPPPLSAFQRSPNSTLLPSPLPLSAATTAADRLFTNIERQLSAKIGFIDPLLLTASGGGGGGGGNGDANDQQKSPLPRSFEQPQYVTQRQDQQNTTITDQTFHREDEQKQLTHSEEGASTQSRKLEGGPPQKGLDAFFAALSNADSGQKQKEKPPPENQLICGGPSTAQFSFPQTSAPKTAFPSDNPNFDNNISNTSPPTAKPSPQNISNQQHLSNAIANAAVNIVNAAIAVQQHQNHQQQQQLAALQFAAHSAASMPLSPQQGLNAQVGAFLNQLSTPNILRPLSTQSKPIPLLEDKVDLMRFKRKEPREWSDDDVIAWILDVARRHRIPCENMNLTKFAKCTGPLLMLMNEQSFKEQDPNYGSLLFGEFCKLVTDETFIDEWMRINGPSCSSSSNDQRQSSKENPHQNYQPQQQQPLPMTRANNAAVGNLLMANLALKLSAPQSSDSSGQQGLLLAAAGIAANNQQQQQHYQQQRLTGPLPPLGQLLSPTVGQSSLLALQQHQGTIHAPAPIHPSQQRQQQIAASVNHILQQQPGGSQQHVGGRMGVRGMRPGQRSLKVAEQKIRRNKDGRPRKRSQHTKGNKLWEFIRDALKDPRTCPSIVRWEDPSEGVFRIVESERLAFLWGQKKNNQKMTYEKLSRAMRTYYEKEILVPVPKSGLYPKKLVYKFGPSAMGWKIAASMSVQTHLSIVGSSADISAQLHHHQLQRL